MAESTAEHSRWEKEKLSYGYLWWTGILNGYAAMGNSGNIIYVNPADKMVAVSYTHLQFREKLCFRKEHPALFASIGAFHLYKDEFFRTGSQGQTVHLVSRCV